MGNYIGIWTNLTFQSSGGVEIDISDAGVLTFDLDEFVFGMLDPDPVVVQGMVLGKTGSASLMDDSFYGDIDVSVDCSNGAVMASVSDIPGGVFNGVMVNGTIGNGLIDLTYDVDAVMGMDSNGTLVAMPEPSAEGSILAVLLALGGLARVAGRAGAESP